MPRVKPSWSLAPAKQRVPSVRRFLKDIVVSRLIEAIDDCLRSVQVVVLSYLQDLAVSEMNIIKLNSHNGNFPSAFFPGAEPPEVPPCRHIPLQGNLLRLSFCRRNRDNICNRNQPRYIRAIDSVHALPSQMPIISFTSRSAIFTAPTKMSILKISSPM